MGLFDFLVVGCTPVSDALEAERMRAIFEDTKSFTVRKDGLQANDALLIIFDQALPVSVKLFWALSFDVPAHPILNALGGHTLGMRVLALVSIPAVTLLVKLADLPISVILQEVVDDVVIVLHPVRDLVIKSCVDLDDSSILLHYCLHPILVLHLTLQLTGETIDQPHILGPHLARDLLLHHRVHRQLTEHIG